MRTEGELGVPDPTDMLYVFMCIVTFVILKVCQRPKHGQASFAG